MELKDKLQLFIKETCKLKNFEYSLIDHLKIKECKPGSTIIELEILKNHCNFRNLLHGGCISALSDMIFCLTWASIDVDDVLNMPNTISTNISFISSIKKGEILNVFCEVEKKTTTLIFLKLKMMDSKGERVVATANCILKSKTRSIQSKL